MIKICKEKLMKYKDSISYDIKINEKYFKIDEIKDLVKIAFTSIHLGVWIDNITEACPGCCSCQDDYHELFIVPYGNKYNEYFITYLENPPVNIDENLFEFILGQEDDDKRISDLTNLCINIIGNTFNPFNNTGEFAKVDYYNL